MKVYTVSYFTQNESAPDGVYDVVSSTKNALKRIVAYCEEYDEDIIDIDCSLNVSKYYTTKGIYLIESFNLDEDCEDNEAETEPPDIDTDFMFNPFTGCFDEDC